MRFFQKQSTLAFSYIIKSNLIYSAHSLGFEASALCRGLPTECAEYVAVGVEERHVDGGKAGIITSHQRKAAMVERLEDLLSSARVKFIADPVVLSSVATSAAAGGAAAGAAAGGADAAAGAPAASPAAAAWKNEMISQLRSFRKVIVEKAEGKSVVFTGKLDASTGKVSARCKDDGAISIQLLFHSELMLRLKKGIRVRPSLNT